MDAEDELLTTKQVHERYGLFEATLRYYRHKGIGPASFRLGRRVCYRRSAVEEWISAQEAASTRGGVA
ncbi:AlpA family transcriptional regulator [Rhodococcus sp. KRD162]|uniref:helix-turn-helix transcriptional regulator n=1 Tax=Rhodococcus sp. KRD162 TaxID=2729725 RepID=UPI0019D15391|nr:helix-turn-helix domain-containing protein [Rhodococcus sp. KRD162]